MFKQAMLVMCVMITSQFIGATATLAKSQCSGLSSSACSSNNTCTWRKSSVDKNGKKTKAHCRALPGKSKATKTVSKSKTTKAKTKKTTTSSATKSSSLKAKTEKKATKTTKTKTTKKKTTKTKTTKAKKKTKSKSDKS